MDKNERQKPGPKPKPIPEQKRCVKCGQIKASSIFAPRRNICKACLVLEKHAQYVRRRDEGRLKIRDREKSREVCRKWNAKNADRIKEYSRKRYENNKEAMNAYSRAYKQKHKARLSFKQHSARAKKYGVLSTATYEEWLSLCSKYEHRCLCCGEQKPLIVDHIISMALGGSDTIENIQPLCKECHCKKHIRMTDYRPKT